MKKFIRLLLNSLGFEIRRKEKPASYGYFRNPEMINGFRHIERLGINFNTIIDVGAAGGEWSLAALEFWPNCDFLLFEPLTERKTELEELVKKQTQFQYVALAAGSAKDVIQFYVADDLDGSGIAGQTNQDKNIRSVETTRIDSEVLNRGLAGPYLIKLDTHGFEVPILQGCEKILSRVAGFIIECYGFNITGNSLLFWEMCSYMDSLGYRLFNVLDVSNRPGDYAFWQCDAVFIDKKHEIFVNNTFH